MVRRRTQRAVLLLPDDRRQGHPKPLLTRRLRHLLPRRLRRLEDKVESLP